MGGFILFLISVLLLWICVIPAYLYGFIVSILRYEWSKFHSNIVVAIDQLGNTIACYLFNDILIKRSGYKFGFCDETISSVLGKNKKLGTLKYLGKWLDNRLNRLEDNHSIKSIEENIKWK